MIINFEDETESLSGIEIKARDVIVSKIVRNVGRERIVTAAKISDFLKEHEGIDLNPARMRKVINSIRLRNLIPCLMATSKGYYVSNDKEELANYVYSLRQRCAAISMLADVIELQYKTK